MSTTTPIVVRFEGDHSKFDLSPWVCRLESLLTFSGASFQLSTGRGDSTKQPRGLLPVIKLGDEVIPDSLFAYQDMVQRGLAKELDARLTTEQKATSRAIESLVEELYWISVKERYVSRLANPSIRAQALLISLLSSRWHDQYYASRDKYALGFLPYPLRVAIGGYLYKKVCRPFSHPSSMTIMTSFWYLAAAFTNGDLGTCLSSRVRIQLPPRHGP